MQSDPLATALEHEHHEIDAGIEAFIAAPSDRQPLDRAIGALRRHIYLEEEFLFSLLLTVEPGLVAPVSVMLREHAQIWDTLDAVERQLGANADPGAGLAACEQLTAQLLHHNLKEERILYPLADVAPASAADPLGKALDSAALPDGWMCQRAAGGQRRDS